MEKKLNFNNSNKFYKYLRDTLKIPKNKCTGIIYYLSETLNIIPDHFEICSKCGKLFDSENEGGYVDYGRKKENGKFYCDECMPYDYAVDLPANFACTVMKHKKPIFK